MDLQLVFSIRPVSVYWSSNKTCFHVHSNPNNDFCLIRLSLPPHFALQDKDFDQQPLFRAHKNPAADLSSSLKHYQQHSLSRLYNGEDFLWALTPLRDDFILFNFPQPIHISGSAGSDFSAGSGLSNPLQVFSIVCYFSLTSHGCSPCMFQVLTRGALCTRWALLAAASSLTCALFFLQVPVPEWKRQDQ